MIFFGEDFWNHCMFVFTFCEDKEEEVKEVKKDFLETLVKKYSIKNNIPMFFVSNKNKTGFEGIKEEVLKMGKLKSHSIDEFKKIDNNETSKDDKDHFVFKLFTDSIDTKNYCQIL
jgi:hypothetical protein